MPVVNNELYDNPESVLARKSQEDPWIMYLIVRESLKMSPGKIAAQVGHGVGIIYNHYSRLKEKSPGPPGDKGLELRSKIGYFDSWQEQSFRKIVLRADDKEWEKLKRQLECFLVADAGLTEVEAGSETVIALWPMLKSSAPPLVKRLQTL